MRSVDSGETWQKVASFPLAGRGLPERGPTNAGLSFVIFDPSTGRRGTPTKTIFVGGADPGAQHLFRSDDAGATWKATEGGPKPEFLPAKAELDDRGVLYITCSNGIGPNGITAGAVMKRDTRTSTWTDITPDKRPEKPLRDDLLKAGNALTQRCFRFGEPYQFQWGSDSIGLYSCNNMGEAGWVDVDFPHYDHSKC